MEIPPYPASRQLTLNDKGLFDLKLFDMQPKISELTFAGLFLFRKAHYYRLTSVKESIILLGRGYDGIEYFMPPIGGDVNQALRMLLSEGLSMYGADENFCRSYLHEQPIQAVEKRDSFDYLYLRSELASLPGSRFHKKKNRINYFTARHDYSVSIFSREHLEGCTIVLNNWFKNTFRDSAESLKLEVDATLEALRFSQELGLEGVVVLVDGQVKAFALGELLNSETAVCHFEKADPFYEGLYQLVNREFASLLFQNCIYLNREQDLGDMGLRNAKLSYHPVELVKKFLLQSDRS